MNRKVFQAGNWFLKQDDRNKAIASRAVPEEHDEIFIPPIPSNELNHAHQKFSNFFTPGWTGGTLISKDQIKFKKSF